MEREGECVCPRCERLRPHRHGLRSQDERCPECGTKLPRVGSERSQLWRKREGDEG